jgi:hypothetical protein
MQINRKMWPASLKKKNQRIQIGTKMTADAISRWDTKVGKYPWSMDTKI